MGRGRRARTPLPIVLPHEAPGDLVAEIERVAERLLLRIAALDQPMHGALSDRARIDFALGAARDGALLVARTRQLAPGYVAAFAHILSLAPVRDDECFAAVILAAEAGRAALGDSPRRA